MNANLFGCYAEYKFAVMAMEHDLLVSFPLLHTSIFDCIVQSEKGLSRVQIKAINEDKRTRKRINLVDRSGRRYQKNDVDFFAIYSKQRDGFFIIKNDLKIQSFTVGLEKYSIYFNNFALL